jgi:D-3-phosphoglycerate dehydrogenase
MMYRVLLTDNITPEAVAVFDAYPDIEAIAVGTLEGDGLKEAVGACDGIVVRSPTRLTAGVIAAAERLRYIGRAGAGTDNIDLAAATRRGVVVMNAPSGNTVSTAEFAIGMLLGLARWIPAAHRSVTRGEWDRVTFRGTELAGKTLGIVGFGRVGREVASRMRAFDMSIVTCDPYVAAEAARSAGVEPTDLDDLMGRSHAVTVHVPLTPETNKLIGASQLERLPEGALLVNCARGGVVCEDALKAALDSNQLAGAALDVYENEPPGDHPLFGHPRCVFAPHLGGATQEARIRVATDAATAVAEALISGTVRNAVNRVV